MGFSMSHQEVREILPQRYPILMIDKVTELIDGPQHPKSRVGRKVTCYKNVSANEPYFTGHFPNRPIMPGVLQLECIAQAGVLACYHP